MQITVINLSVQICTSDQLGLRPDAAGNACIRGQPILTLSHLPGRIAVAETSEGLFLVPWTVLIALFNRVNQKDTLP